MQRIVKYMNYNKVLISRYEIIGLNLNSHKIFNVSKHNFEVIRLYNNANTNKLKHRLIYQPNNNMNILLPSLFSMKYSWSLFARTTHSRKYSLNNLCKRVVGGTLSNCYCEYSTNDKKTCVNHKNIKQRAIIQDVLKEKKERFKESGQILLNDIRETKNKMKEKMEEVIERENVWTVPNLLCVMRIAISPFIGYLIIQSNYDLALGLLVVAGISDVLDGWIARTFKSQASKMGSFLDPMADKVLIASLFLTLTYNDLIPVVLTCTIIARDVFLVGAGFYIRYQSLPPPKTLARYFDVTHATAQLAPTGISKVNTAVQLLLVASTLAAPVFNYVDHQLLHALWYVTAGTTIASALSYVISRNTYKYLRSKK